MTASKDLVPTGETIPITVIVPDTRVRKGGERTLTIPVAVAETFPAIGRAEEIADLFAETFADGESLGVGDLTRVVVPDGKSVAFTIDEDPRKTFDGVITLHQARRNWWEKSIEEGGGNQAPDCASRDAVHGNGRFGEDSELNPSGLCKTCPVGQWRDDPVTGNRVPPPCKPQTAVLVMVENQAFPLLLTVPRTSLKAFHDYWKKKLFMGMKHYAQVVTRFGLESTKNAGGMAYNLVTFTEMQDLGFQVRQVMLSIGEQYRPVLTKLDSLRDSDPAEKPAAPPVDADLDGGGVSFDEPVDDKEDPFEREYENSAVG
jgi:hypothetical protein